MPQQGSKESLWACKTRIYNTMATILRVGSATPVMWVARRWPQVDWEMVWENLRDAPVLETTRMAWYRVVHDILLMNEHLHRINRSPTEACKHCGKTDTIGHHLTDYWEGSRIWNWMYRRIATMLRTIPDRIPDGCLTHPQFKIWPQNSAEQCYGCWRS